MRLGLREANQRFSQTIKAVRAAREVILTDRGHPIAVTTPIKGEGGRDAMLQRMAEQG
jgi:prevent-host-death family protein